MAETLTTLTEDGRTLAFCEWGLDDGAPVFYLHGLPGSRLLRHSPWMYESAGARVVTLDRAGFGLSTRDEGRTVASSAKDVLVVADALGIDRFAVLGVSAGGPYSLALAAIAPDRVTACATEVGIGPFDAEGLDFFDGMAQDDVRYYRAWTEGDSAFLEEDFRGTAAWIESLQDATDLPEDVRTTLSEAFTEGLRGGYPAFFDEEAALLSPWGFDLGTIVCPVRIATARDDVTVPPAHGRWLAAHVPGAELVMLDGGHIHSREPEEVTLLTWLASHR